MPDFTPITDPLDGISPTTVDEASRASLWRSQLAQRTAFRGRLEASLVGSGARRVALQGKFQPLLNALADAQVTAPDDEEVETVPVSNFGANL